MDIRRASLVLLTTAALLAAWLLPAMAQPLSYHQFADCRGWWNVPNALNVLSNLPFLLAGGLGLHVAMSATRSRFHDDHERLAYMIFFLGAALTCFGSMYYHAAPDNPRLVWDRLPMTFAFAGLVAAVIGERVDHRWGGWLLWPLLALGALSVYYWYATELAGHGNVLPYGMFQAWSIGILLLIVALWPSHRYSHGSHIAGPILLYGLAKIAETFDLAIWRATDLFISGHTLKHLLAAGAVFLVYRMLSIRDPLPVRG